MNHSKNRTGAFARSLMASAAGAALLFANCPAWAQAAAEAASAAAPDKKDAAERGPEKVVVTAQRRKQDINKVPVAVTAFSEGDLDQGSISEAKEYLAQTPNVAFTEDGESGNRGINISIRGVSDVDLGEVSVANSIGYYIDEVSVGSVANGVINPQLLDLERIEVLRGPQGTYFGRNSSAGALNITTKLPNAGHYMAVEASAGSFGSWGVNGIANTPLSDKVFFRLAAASEHSDGIVENINPKGAPNSGFEYYHVRAAVRALLSDNSTLDISATYTKEDEGADASVPTGVLDLDTKSIFGAFTPVNTTGFYPKNIRRFDHDANEYNNKEFVILNARYQYDFENMSLRSITGYVGSENGRFFDQDNIFSDTIIRRNAYDGRSISQEVRLQSEGDSPLQWTLGAIYADDQIDQFNTIRAGATGSILHPNLGVVVGLLPPIPAGFRINENNRRFETTSVAVFADATYQASDRLALTAGGRYTQEDIDVRFFRAVAFEGAVPDSRGSKSFDDFSPRVAATYEIAPEMSLYGTVSRGYKAGGIDNLPGGLTKSFDPETLWNYELGLKGYIGAARDARFSIAAFLVDWKDLQVQSNFLLIPGDISSGVEITQNADSARNKGIEAELDWNITSKLNFTGAVGFLDSEFGDFKNAKIKGGFTVDMTGQRLPRTPEWTWSTAFTYTTPISNSLEGFLRVEANGRSDSRSDLEAIAQIAAPALGLPEFPYHIPSFAVVNLRVGVDAENYKLNAFVENLFEEDYYTSTSDNFGLSGMRVRPHPRVFGVRLGMKLGDGN